jgi:hypothetical protein
MTHRIPKRRVPGIRELSTKKVLTISPVGFIYVRRATQAKSGARGRAGISMLMNLTQTNIITASSLWASGRTCAGLFSKAACFATVSCAGSLPAYLPGVKLMHKGANFGINLRNYDRRVTLI